MKLVFYNLQNYTCKSKILAKQTKRTALNYHIINIVILQLLVNKA